MTTPLLRSILKLRDRREQGALCTIVKTEGSTPLKAGAQMLVRSDGSIEGTIGGGALEYAVIQQALTAISLNAHQLVLHRLTRDHNMCCGGTVYVYIQIIEVPPQCFIFGAGHVGKALANLVASLDFEVVLIDGRLNMFDNNRVAQASSLRAKPRILPPAIQYVNDEPDEALSSLIWDSNTYAIIATHSHPLDREVLRLALRKPFAYCGMIGSKRKVIVTRKLFLERGWATEEELDRIDMPVGIDIAAESPAEIAVSIAARMIEMKNRNKLGIRNEKLGMANESISCSSLLISNSSFLITNSTNDLACASTAL